MGSDVADEDFQIEVHESNLMEIQKVGADAELDDDGRSKRTGNVWSASAHIITAIIGSGVLSLAWGVAQLGWVAGVSTLLVFSGITLYTSNLLADCYRSPGPISGKRNYTYMQSVKSNLGGTMQMACGMVQYTNLTGMIIGYTITASISMEAVQKSNCYHHKRGNEAAECSFSHNPYMIGLGVVEVFLSQIPNFHKLSFLSIVAATMSFAYASIGMGLAFAKLISGEGKKTSITGLEVGIDLSAADKAWRMFRAFGDIAFAYTYSQILIEIQDTLKSSPPESRVMKKANVIGVLTTTAFYTACGCLGYAAFGNHAPGNLLTGFGFYEPFWLVDLANIFIVVHLVGAYQVFSQPVFSAVETWAKRRWPESQFVRGEHPVGMTISGKRIGFSANFFRLTWRTGFVAAVTVLAMALPFFNEILALLGALGYWPLTVFFPIQMHISQRKIGRWSCRWLGLQLINSACFVVALAAACGSVQGIAHSLTQFKLFQVQD